MNFTNCNVQYICYPHCNRLGKWPLQMVKMVKGLDNMMGFISQYSHAEFVKLTTSAVGGQLAAWLL